MLYHKIMFANSTWLWGLLLIPIIWLLIRFYKHKVVFSKQLTDFADPELLPHLINNNTVDNKPKLNLLTLWSLLWAFGIIAMAGPRFRYIEYETYQPDAALVIILDLSRTMGAEDLKPTRIIRAKQQIQDIVHLGRGIRVGLIGFAKIPHLITPITDDFTTILHLLPAVDIDLINKQGVNLPAALAMADKLLTAEPGESKHILIVSDGNFSNYSLQYIKQLRQNGIVTSVVGIGTPEGAPFKDVSGRWHNENGKMVIAKLNTDILTGAARAGKGRYWQASYNEQDTLNFVKQVANNTTNKIADNAKIKQWEESFFWLLFPMLIIALLMQHKHLQFGVYVVIVILFWVPKDAFALEIFANDAKYGEELFQNGEYEKAAEKFSDPYRKGVALYKAGQFAAAEQEFSKAKRLAIALSAKYNLGNALLKQGKYKLAIDAYKSVLTDDPNHMPAKENLAIAEKLWKKQPEEPEKKEDKSCSCDNNKEQDNKQDPERKQASDNKTNQKQEHNDSLAKESKDDNEDNKAQENAGDNGNSAEQENKAQQSNNDQAGQQHNDNVAKQPENMGTEATGANRETSADNTRDIDLAGKKEKEAELANDPAKEATSNDKSHTEQDKLHSETAVQHLSKDLSEQEKSVDPATELWLQRLNNDIKIFLKNKFLIEEQQRN